MAEYHYKYTPSGPPGQNGGQSYNNGNNDVAQWIGIILALAFIPPLGFLLLVLKLFHTPTAGSARSRGRAGSSYHYNYTYQAPKAQAAPGVTQTAQAAQAAQPRPAQAVAKSVTSAPGQIRPKAGRGFIIGGSIVTGVFGFTLIYALADAFVSGLTRGAFTTLVSLASFTGVGLVLLYTGLFRRKRSKRFRKYQALIGRRDTVSISTLSKATGKSYKKVCDDLQDMLDCGVLPMGYLDLANDKLVLTTQGIADEEDPEESEEETHDDYDFLTEIRAVNDSIPDPVMSAKIDRIGEITRKILDYQRQNPSKAGQLRTFLNYYLPTTLKILRAYAQLDQQGIEGENISAAKARIEGMMDKVVEGFEKQLDKLFQDDALDITSDVAVLEKMLDNDGLGQGGMTLGL